MLPKEVIIIYNEKLEPFLSYFRRSGYHPFIAKVRNDMMDDNVFMSGIVVELPNGSGFFVFEDEWVPNNKFFRRLHGLE